MQPYKLKIVKKIYTIHIAFYLKKIAIKAIFKLKQNIGNSKRIYNKERERT